MRPYHIALFVLVFVFCFCCREKRVESDRIEEVSTDSNCLDISSSEVHQLDGDSGIHEITDIEIADKVDVVDLGPEQDKVDQDTDISAIDQTEVIEEIVPCQPDCEGKVCGLDGCGSLCGFCKLTTESCVDGKCVDCIPECNGKDCGSDGCGGSCGTCPVGKYCSQQFSKCFTGSPDCTQRECGSDGSGGSCGECEAPQTCLLGKCVLPGEECEDGNDESWDGCTYGYRSERLLVQAEEIRTAGMIVTGSNYRFYWVQELLSPVDDYALLSQGFTAEGEPESEPVFAFLFGDVAELWKWTSVAGLSDGRAVAVHRRPSPWSPYATQLVYAIMDSNGELEIPPKVLTPDFKYMDVSWAEVTGIGDQAFAISYFMMPTGPDYQDQNWEIRVDVYSLDGQLMNTTTIHSGSADASCDWAKPAVLSSSADGGQVFAAWTAQKSFEPFYCYDYDQLMDDNGDGVIGQFIPNLADAPQESPFVINGKQQGHQQVEMTRTLESGNYVVSWTDYPGSETIGGQSSLYSRVVSADGEPQGDDNFLLEYNSGMAIPYIAALGDERWLFLGSTHPYMNDEVFHTLSAAVYTGTSGQPEQSFSPMLCPAATELYGEAYSLMDGSVLIVWENRGCVSNGDVGLFFRHYSLE